MGDRFFIYGEFEVSAPLVDGNDEIRYVGGAYGHGAERPQKHVTGTCGCNPGCSPWRNEVQARGGTVAWKILLVTEDDATTRAAEGRVWEELRLAGHRVQPARPGYWNLTPEAKEKHASATKEAQNRPGERARNSARQKIAQNRPEVLERQSASQKAVMSRPETQARHSAAVKVAMNQPETIKAQKDAWALPGVRDRRSATLKAASARPEVHARRCAAQKTAQNQPEVNARRSASLKATWARKKAGL